MAQIKISQADATTLNALKGLPADDANRKSAKKNIFNGWRATFGIPTNVKLKVNIEDPRAADFLVLKDKASGRDLAGDTTTTGSLRYTGLAPLPAPVPTVTATISPAAQQVASAVAAGGGSFAAVRNDVRRISIAALLDSLRFEGDGDDTTLPTGAVLGGDAILVDGGFVYFKA